MNRTILHIDSSALARRFLDRWLAENPGDRVVHRDVASNPIPHLDQTALAGLFSPAEQRTPEMQAAVDRVDTLVEEFLAADVLVLGVPMYNFGIPSTLKAYIDHISQVGRTFKYTEQGPVGLAGNKQVFVLSSRGGVYDDSPMDHQAAYLRTVFGFLGIDDVEIIHAEGLNMSEEAREQALASARRAIDESVTRALAA